MKKNIFNSFTGLIDVVPTPVTLEQVLELIRHDEKIEKQTHQFRYFRANHQEKEADRIKTLTPCISVSVHTQNGRKKEDIIAWTGVGMVDIDHIDPTQMAQVMEQVNADPHTLLSYTTLSGLGRRILFYYDGLQPYEEGCTPSQHEEVTKKNEQVHRLAFQAVNEYYEQLTGCKTDAACKNCNRLSVLAHDEQVYYNPDAKIFHTNHLVRQQKDQKNQQKQNQRQKERLPKVAAVIEEELKEKGIQYAPHSHNEYVSKFGYQLNAFGIPEEMAIAWAEAKFSDYRETASVLRSCYRNTAEHNTRKLPSGEGGRSKGKKRPSITSSDILTQLESVGRFRFNEVTHHIEMSKLATPNEWFEITDRDVNDIWYDLSNVYSGCRRDDIYSVLHSNHVPLYNPFHAYFEQCPTWDGTTDYIGQLASTIHLKENPVLKDQDNPFVRSKDTTAYFQKYFKMWFVAMVDSLKKKDSINHEVLLLIGKQGIYKTTWIKHLMPPELRRYILIKPQNKSFNRDDLLAVSEFAIICLEELEAMDTGRMAEFKSIATMPEIQERMPYARTKEHHPHLCSFCGTTNQVEVINDHLGTRRWIAVEVESIDIEVARSINYAGLYAQALALNKQEFKYWFGEAETDEVDYFNQTFESTSLEKELILKYFRKPKPGERATFMSVADILATISQQVRQSLSVNSIGIIMKNLGFEKKTSNNHRGYLVIRRSSDEIYEQLRPQ